MKNEFHKIWRLPAPNKQYTRAVQRKKKKKKRTAEKLLIKYKKEKKKNHDGRLLEDAFRERARMSRTPGVFRAEHVDNKRYTRTCELQNGERIYPRPLSFDTF